VTRANPLIGKWRIVETDLWGKDYLDMLEPAFIAFKDDGRGEFRFGCVTAGLDCHYSSAAADFTWQGADEMDEASGEASLCSKTTARSPAKSPSIAVTKRPSKPKSGNFSAAC
jgi:hypothetical protein